MFGFEATMALTLIVLALVAEAVKLVNAGVGADAAACSTDTVCWGAFPAVTATVAVRVPMLGFGSALRVSVFPFCDVLSHAWLELADQLPWFVVTVMFVVPPPAGGFHEPLEIERAGGATTVTAQVAVLPPWAVVTVMAALPADMPVTRPVAGFTVATFGLLSEKTTVFIVAFDGDMVSWTVNVPPMPILWLVGETDTLSTSTML